jgi:hypothetical protein
MQNQSEPVEHETTKSSVPNGVYSSSKSKRSNLTETGLSKSMTSSHMQREPFALQPPPCRPSAVNDARRYVTVYHHSTLK